MDKQETTFKSDQYKLTNPDELMEYMWLKTNVTGLNVDVFVDDGLSYLRNNHKLLLFARNGYDKSACEFIPFSIEQSPCVLDGSVNFNISCDNIAAILNFIQLNIENLILLANNEISQEVFIQQIKKLPQ